MNVGSLVFDCDYRHPAVLARELATIDLLSEGRLEVGLGAGWKKLDYDRSGIPMEAPKVRVDRMIEHTKILKALFADEPGHLRRASTTASPICRARRVRTRRAVRRSSSAAASARVLRFAGAIADIVGVNASIHSGEVDTAAAHDAMPERIDEKVGWLREGAGARFDDIEINAWLAAAEVTDDTAGVADADGSAVQRRSEGRARVAAHADRFARRSAPIACANGASGGATATRVIPGEKARDFAPLVAELTGHVGAAWRSPARSRPVRTSSTTSSRPNGSATSGRGCSTRPRCTATSG